MTKRFFLMILAMVMTAMAVIPAALANDGTGAGNDPGYWYVYTENGKSLNVRATPRGEVVGVLKYGARIHVDSFVDENWALILFNYDNGYGKGDYAAFVNRRFLTKKKPEARKSSAFGQAAASPADALTAMNEEFRSARNVEPYKVSVRPTRVSGWVNMRWAPSKDAELIATYRANDELLVIKELNGWLQVEDQDTGNVGFVSRQFVAE